MAYATGMLLGAFFLLYCFYAWMYGRRRVTNWETCALPLYYLWYDTYFHSKASLRRVVQVWKLNWIIAAAGAVMGWGTTNSVLQLFR